MTSQEIFAMSLQYGKLGEAFFDRYVGSLLRAPVFIRGQKLKLLEGADSFYLQEGVNSQRKGFAEVKTYSSLSILKYGNKSQLTIPFELSSYQAGEDQTGKEWRPGWGLQLLFPDQYNEYAVKKGLKTRAVGTSTLAYLFCESDSKTEVEPFVCIAFENFRQTRDIIINAGKLLFGEGFDDWDIIIDKQAKMWQGKKGVHDNEWNIPFSELYNNVDTTITMIDDPPSSYTIEYFSPEDHSKYNKEQMDQYIQWRYDRLERLKELSQGRWFSSVDEEKRMLEIEKTAGCRVHKIPYVPARILINADDAAQFPTQSEFYQSLKQYTQEAFEASDDPYWHILKACRMQEDRFDYYARMLSQFAHSNFCIGECVKNRIQAMKFLLENINHFQDDDTQLNEYICFSSNVG